MLTSQIFIEFHKKLIVSFYKFLLWSKFSLWHGPLQIILQGLRFQCHISHLLHIINYYSKTSTIIWKKYIYILWGFICNVTWSVPHFLNVLSTMKVTGHTQNVFLIFLHTYCWTDFVSLKVRIKNTFMPKKS